jgi:hypothetical protein
MNYYQVDAMRNVWLNPIDQPDNEPHVCAHCHRDFKPASDENDMYCNESCWHLHRLGEVKAQVLQWKASGRDEKSVIRMMKLYWFYWMTDSTVKRWKVAIHNLFNKEWSNYAH